MGVAKERYVFLDVAKGIGIVLVIMGHLVTLRSVPSTLIYSFHMPFFFIISGMFAGTKLPFKDYVVHKFKQLIIPFLVYFVIGLCFKTLLLVSGLDDKPFDVNNIVYQFFIAHPRDIFAGPIWFLTCLFGVTLLYFFCDKCIFRYLDNIVLKLLFLMVLYTAAYYVPIVLRKYNFRYIPFNWDIVLMALFFFCIGHFLKQYILELSKLNVA